MNVLDQLITVLKTDLIATIQLDRFNVLVPMDILEMELLAKVKGQVAGARTVRLCIHFHFDSFIFLQIMIVYECKPS